MSDEKSTRMRAFAGNSYEDYYDHAMVDFPWTARLVMNIVVAACWAFTKLVWPWKIEQAELLTDDARGRVIIQNHESMVEPVIMVVTLWRAGIHTRIVYKSEFDKIGIATWLFSRVRGECVLIYPEGTRVKDDAQAEVHGGYALMAQMAKAPVQPVAVIGARNLRVRSRVWLKAGRPVEWSEIDAPKRREQVAKMEEVGMGRVFELRDELRQTHPGLE